MSVRENKAVIAAKSLRMLWVVACVLACTWSASAQAIYVGDIDGEAVDDFSGDAVSLSSDGMRVAVGAYRNDGNGMGAGHVRVFEYQDTAWVQLGEDIDGEAAYDRSGRSVSLSGDGHRVAVDATFNNDNGASAGHVRVFEYVDGAWEQLGEDIDGEAAFDESGYSVSLSSDGHRVAIGAPGNVDNGDYAGHVRVFEYMDGAWVQVGSDIDGEAEGDFSGESVALSSDGSRVAIGASFNNDGGEAAGQVRVFEYLDTGWVQLGHDLDGEAAKDAFGESVAISDDGTIVAVGASDNSGNGAESGHVRVFAYRDTAWVQLGEDLDGEAAGDGAGSSVALSSDGHRVAIGAPTNEGKSRKAGHVRVFEYRDGAWAQMGSDLDGEAAYDASGSSVALSSDGSRVAIGAPTNDGNGEASGHVRIYDYNGRDWVLLDGGA